MQLPASVSVSPSAICFHSVIKPTDLWSWPIVYVWVMTIALLGLKVKINLAPNPNPNPNPNRPPTPNPNAVGLTLILSWGQFSSYLVKWAANFLLPSVLWRCWLGGRKSIWPVKHWVVGCWRGYVLRWLRCRFTHVPADATATDYLLLQ